MSRREEQESGPLIVPATVSLADGGFKVLTWLGFIAMDQDRRSEFYIDNLTLEGTKGILPLSLVYGDVVSLRRQVNPLT